MAEAGHRGGTHSPATPSANGRQERFHRTLKQHTADPPVANRRPYQALGQQVPASLYRPSDRAYPSQLPEIEYPSSFPRRQVGKRGEIYWRGARIFVSEVLYREPLGLEAIADGVYRVWFCSLELGTFDERRGKLAPLSRRRDNGPSGPASPVPNGCEASSSSEPPGSSEAPSNPESTNNLESTNNSESTLTTPTKGGNLFTMSPV